MGWGMEKMKPSSLVTGIAVAVAICLLIGLFSFRSAAAKMPNDSGASASAAAKRDAAASSTVSRAAILKKLSDITKAPGAASAGFGQDLGCVGPAGLNNKNTPMSLDVALAKCIATKQFGKAVFITELSLAYARFDALRVADKTAHGVTTQVLPLLLAQVPKSNVKKYAEHLKEVSHRTSRLKRNCTALHRIGPPDYYPQYMIAHGMQMFTGFDTAHGLVSNFDANLAWSKVLENYMHCPGPNVVERTKTNAKVSEKATLYSKDSLQPTKNLGCLSPEKLNSSTIPPNLYPAIVSCVKKDQVKDAVFMMMMAGVYSDFDTRRVVDPTTYHVNIVLIHRIKPLLSKSEFKKLGTNFVKTLKTPSRQSRVCERMEKMGPPTYYPRYMIQFGIQAVTGFKSPEGLVKSFDPKTAWHAALTEYLRCSNIDNATSASVQH